MKEKFNVWVSSYIEIMMNISIKELCIKISYYVTLF